MNIGEFTRSENGRVSGYIDTTRSGFVPLRIFQSRQDAKVWNVVRQTARRRQVTDEITLPAQAMRSEPEPQDWDAPTRRGKAKPSAPAEESLAA